MKTLLTALLLSVAMPLQASEAQLERGRQVFNAASCAVCHTDTENNGEPLAGGYALKTDFGTFYSPNITPDPETGIGNWSDEDLSLIHISEPTRPTT